MTDAQLLVLLRMILSKLEDGVDLLEKELPETFKIESGGTNILLDPLRIDIPVLNPLYDLKHELRAGIRELEQSNNRIISVINK